VSSDRGETTLMKEKPLEIPHYATYDNTYINTVLEPKTKVLTTIKTKHENYPIKGRVAPLSA
jgi:hypothetical protein